jgi:ABC-type Zn2+ transport system substrate-binding protein/surface adhesin
MYTFARFIQAGIPVVRFTEQGSWLQFDGNKVTEGPNRNENNNWRKKEYWLLLDGKADVHFLSKIKRGIVFASPKRKNYHKYLKTSEGKTFYMPPWSLDEIEDFIIKTRLKDASVNLFNKFNIESPANYDNESTLNDNDNYNSNENFLIENNDFNESSTEHADTHSEDDSNHSDFQQADLAFNLENEVIPVATSNPPDEITKAIIQIVRQKYYLIGGKLRLLLSKTLQELKYMLGVELEKGTMNILDNIGLIDIRDQVPSNLYSIYPQNNYQEFTVDFASDYIAVLALNRIQLNDIKDFSRLYHAVDKSLADGGYKGKMFERFIHKLFLKGVNWECSLVKSQSEEDMNDYEERLSNLIKELGDLNSTLTRMIRKKSDLSKVQELFDQVDKIKNLILEHLRNRHESQGQHNLSIKLEGKTIELVAYKTFDEAFQYFNAKYDGNNLNKAYYFIPYSKIAKTLDSFLIYENNMIVIQITVSETHVYDGKVLQQLKTAFQNKFKPNFLFVVPSGVRFRSDVPNAYVTNVDVQSSMSELYEVHRRAPSNEESNFIWKKHTGEHRYGRTTW